MLGSYFDDVARMRYAHTTGQGTATRTVPAGAWIVEISATADAVDATIVITRAGGAALDAITVPAGASFTIDMYDRGDFCGGTIAFTDAQDFYVRYAVPA
jgi:hypothetical protein